MNSFNKTEATVFSCMLCFLRAFPFISLFLFLTVILISNNYYIYLKKYFEIFVTNDFLNIYWRSAALKLRHENCNYMQYN